MRKISSIICLALGIAACTDEQVGPQTPSTNETRIVNGMLVFNSSRDLTQAIENARDLPANSYVYNFTSKQDLLENIIKEERKNMDALDTLEGEALAKAPKHSSTYQKALENGIIKEIHYTDGSTSYDLNLCLPAYAKVINEEGFFAINDTIFQVTGDKVKIWYNGDIENTHFLTNTENNISSENIYIYQFSKQNPSFKSNNNSRAFSFPVPPIPIEIGSIMRMLNNGDRYGFIFYDKIGIADAEHYIRNLHVRIFGQEKINGTNSYNYKSFTYGFRVNLIGNVNNEKINYQPMLLTGTASNIWYTIYPSLNLCLEGKNPQTTDEPYVYFTYMYGVINLLREDGGINGYTSLKLSRSSIEKGFDTVVDKAGPSEPFVCELLQEIPAE